MSNTKNSYKNCYDQTFKRKLVHIILSRDLKQYTSLEDQVGAGDMHLDEIDFVNKIGFIKRFLVEIQLDPELTALFIEQSLMKQKIFIQQQNEDENDQQTQNKMKQTIKSQQTKFQEKKECQDQEETKQVLFSIVIQLPDELIIFTIQYLDPYSIFAFRQTSSQMRQLCKQNFIKNCIIQLSNQILLQNPLLRVNDQAQFYKGFKNKLQLFFRRPRVKFRGCYLCRTEYYREGLSQQSTINPRHKISFYRLLRFFPDGYVAFLCKNNVKKQRELLKKMNFDPFLEDELAPVPDGVKFGTWEIIDDLVKIKVKAFDTEYLYNLRIKDSSQEMYKSKVKHEDVAKNVNSHLFMEFTGWKALANNNQQFQNFNDFTNDRQYASIQLYHRERHFEFIKMKSYKKTLLRFKHIGALL